MPLSDDVRFRVARGLEAGAWDGPVARVLSRAWGAVASRRLARPLVWPAGVRGIVVGGATLGGSGKTPLAIACAREASRGGARVAFVAHGYRSRVDEARVVQGDDDVRLVGDEALMAARALRGMATVVVGRRRQQAIERAAREADVIVVDGVLQTAPERAWLSLLAVDGDTPWGSGEVVPRGDLRASREALVGVADRVVGVGVGVREPLSRVARVISRGAFVGDRLVPWSSLSGLRLGLFTALARPSRLVASLARHGITPAAIVSFADHATPSLRDLTRRLGAHRVDLWVASAKCATRLESAQLPHATLEYDVVLDESLVLAIGMSRNDPCPRPCNPSGDVLPRVPS